VQYIARWEVRQTIRDWAKRCEWSLSQALNSSDRRFWISQALFEAERAVQFPEGLEVVEEKYYEGD